MLYYIKDINLIIFLPLVIIIILIIFIELIMVITEDFMVIVVHFIHFKLLIPHLLNFQVRVLLQCPIVHNEDHQAFPIIIPYLHRCVLHYYFHPFNYHFNLIKYYFHPHLLPDFLPLYFLNLNLISITKVIIIIAIIINSVDFV